MIPEQHTFGHKVEEIRKEHADLRRDAQRAEAKVEAVLAEIFLREDGAIELRKMKAKVSRDYQQARDRMIVAEHLVNMKMAEIKGLETAFDEWKEKRWAGRAGDKMHGVG